jgi:hypothetical protein
MVYLAVEVALQAQLATRLGYLPAESLAQQSILDFAQPGDIGSFLG